MTQKEHLYLTATSSSKEELFQLILDLQVGGFLDKYEMSWCNDFVSHNRSDILNYVIEHGVASLLSTGMAQDSIMSKAMSQQDVSFIFHGHVKNLILSDRVIIIDPYFYASEKNSLVSVAELFFKLIQPVVGDVKTIYVVSKFFDKNRVDELNKEIEFLCKKSSFIVNFFTNSFHDRFWLNPKNNRGFVVGTSLNGIGKKICLVGKIEEKDVCELINLLRVDGFNFLKN